MSLGALVLCMALITACGGNSDKETAEGTSNMNETETATESPATNQMTAETADDADKTVNGKLNINTATGEAFRTIPNVGDKMVHEFEEYRPYVSIQQFRKEIGKYVDEDQVAEYENYIYVPIDRNNSDAVTVMQIPGLDEEEANELVEGRPYETNQEFIETVRLMVNDEELAIAEAYLVTE